MLCDMMMGCADASNLMHGCADESGCADECFAVPDPLGGAKMVPFLQMLEKFLNQF